MNRMFPFITCTWNPLGGACPHECIYCWARTLSKRYGHDKYLGKPRLYEKVLEQKFKPGDFVFVQDMSDLFAETVPTRLILKVLDTIHNNSEPDFLLMTKNPERYIRFVKDGEITGNVVLGATLESYQTVWSNATEDNPSQYKAYHEISNAPTPRTPKLLSLRDCFKGRIFVSIEPIMDFDTAQLYPGGPRHDFAPFLKKIEPWAVAVGYDNYNHKLPEPSLEKTMRLITELEQFTTVYRKSIRKAWWEK